ncbi:hypothetical protein CHGG_02590 [Chaetomium globosum CBS 148.51]|uniref:Uncharacterized protein n=1 Tax=Chaetomium globosum (strain ATCC 6205 / CBS 148.51 / DSM 1962 / NBRC 6347 / NRRL 1970) TaxID=306901 RepID=Q2HB14_CHAGB|nr:uncharacterized protein CHGG_02590 [Chaetomium globosum CBS 148.51]EAQ90655.1 hypothetical protein CHGG_02590 [Chaetomium globosum CBS 148.51]
MSTTTTPNAPTGPITTPLTTLLGIRHPILLAGMARTSNGRLAAAVSNAGGLGVIGGFMYTPPQLREIVAELKAHLASPDLPFGIDLALPQVGGGARKTNHDYTGGRLEELIDITVESGARLFVSAVGVPPVKVIERLHAAGILVMNMVGHPKHAVKALELGVDMVCAQGGEGGGHTGDVANSVLIPAVVDVARQYRPKMLGGEQTALVVAAGGISNGRGLASSLMQGAAGVRVGTRFVASVEAGQVVGAIQKTSRAGEIVDEMVAEAVDMLKLANFILERGQGEQVPGIALAGLMVVSHPRAPCLHANANVASSLVKPLRPDGPEHSLAFEAVSRAMGEVNTPSIVWETDAYGVSSHCDPTPQE